MIRICSLITVFLVIGLMGGVWLWSDGSAEIVETASRGQSTKEVRTGSGSSISSETVRSSSRKADDSAVKPATHKSVVEEAAAIAPKPCCGNDTVPDTSFGRVVRDPDIRELQRRTRALRESRPPDLAPTEAGSPKPDQSSPDEIDQLRQRVQATLEKELRSQKNSLARLLIYEAAFDAGIDPGALLIQANPQMQAELQKTVEAIRSESSGDINPIIQRLTAMPDSNTKALLLVDWYQHALQHAPGQASQIARALQGIPSSAAVKKLKKAVNYGNLTEQAKLDVVDILGKSRVSQGVEGLLAICGKARSLDRATERAYMYLANFAHQAEVMEAMKAGLCSREGGQLLDLLDRIASSANGSSTMAYIARHGKVMAVRIRAIEAMEWSLFDQDGPKTIWRLLDQSDLPSEVRVAAIRKAHRKRMVPTPSRAGVYSDLLASLATEIDALAKTIQEQPTIDNESSSDAMKQKLAELLQVNRDCERMRTELSETHLRGEPGEEVKRRIETLDASLKLAEVSLARLDPDKKRRGELPPSREFTLLFSQYQRLLKAQRYYNSAAGKNGDKLRRTEEEITQTDRDLSKLDPSGSWRKQGEQSSARATIQKLVNYRKKKHYFDRVLAVWAKRKPLGEEAKRQVETTNKILKQIESNLSLLDPDGSLREKLPPTGEFTRLFRQYQRLLKDQRSYNFPGRRIDEFNVDKFRRTEEKISELDRELSLLDPSGRWRTMLDKQSVQAEGKPLQVPPTEEQKNR